MGTLLEEYRPSLSTITKKDKNVTSVNRAKEKRFALRSLLTKPNQQKSNFVLLKNLKIFYEIAACLLKTS